MGYFDKFEKYQPNSNQSNNSNNDYFSQFEKYRDPNSLAQQNVITNKNNVQTQTNPTVVQAPVNNQISAQSVNSNPTPFRDVGVEIGRALLPKPVENWWYGSQEDQQLLKLGGSGIPSREQNQELYNNGQITQEQFIQNLQNRTKYDNALADKEYRDVRNANIGKGAFDIGTAALPLGLAGQFVKGGVALSKMVPAAKIASKLTDAQKIKYAKQIQKLAEKRILENPNAMRAIKVASSIADGTTIGAGFGAFNNIYDNLTGMPNENSLSEEIGKSALIGAGFGTGIPIVGGILKGLANTKAVQNLGNAFAEKYPNFTGTLGDILNFEIKNPFANKYKELNRLIAEGNAPIDKRMSVEAKNELENAKDITPSENKQIINDLQYGLTEQRTPAQEKQTKHSTTVKTDEEETKWWEDLLEREKAEAQAKAEKEAAEKAEYADKMRDMQKAWEEQVQKEAEQHRVDTDNFKFPEERNANPEQKFEYIPDEIAQNTNVQKWNVDNLPHLTQQEADAANLKVQQLKWNEKRKIQKQAEANRKLTKDWKLPEEQGAENNKFEFINDDADKYQIKTEDVKDDNNFFKQKQLEHVEDDLSHVKSETDVSNPKQDETRLKTQSDMSDDIKLLPGEERKSLPQKSEEDYADFLGTNKNVFVKDGSIRSVDKNGRVTVYNPDGTIKVRFKRNTIKEATKEQPREILDYERAEGSNTVDWYTQKADAKPKRLGDENMYENYDVEGTKPTTDKELMQEIEAAKGQKDVPVVRSEVNIKPKTPAQRMAERLQNERANRAWVKHLKSKGKYKSLNSDLPNDAKTYEELLYENNGISTNKQSYVDVTGHDFANRLIKHLKNDGKNPNFSIGLNDFIGKGLPFSAIERKLKGVDDDLLNTLSMKFKDKTFVVVDKTAPNAYDAFQIKKGVNGKDYVEVAARIESNQTRVEQYKRQFAIDSKSVISKTQGNKNVLKSIELNKRAVDNAKYVFEINDAVEQFKLNELFDANNLKLIKNQKIILTELEDEFSGFFNNQFNHSIINLKNTENLRSIIAHEIQHAIDEFAIKQLPNGNILKTFYNKLLNDYSNSIEHLEKSKSVFDSVLREMAQNNGDDLIKLNEAYQNIKNDGYNNTKLFDNMFNIIDNVFGKHSTRGNVLKEFFNSQKTYETHFVELRAKNAENGIKNKSVIQELRSLYGKHIKNVRGRIGNTVVSSKKDVGQYGKTDERFGRGLQTNFFKRDLGGLNEFNKLDKQSIKQEQKTGQSSRLGRQTNNDTRRSEANARIDESLHEGDIINDTTKFFSKHYGNDFTSATVSYKQRTQMGRGLQTNELNEYRLRKQRVVQREVGEQTNAESRATAKVDNSNVKLDDINAEKMWLGDNIDKPYNDLGLLYDKNNSPIGKSIQDLSKTNFAKIDRVFTSHKISDFAEEIASGDVNIKNAIKNYLGEKHTFDFDNLSKESHGRTNVEQETFTLNLNDTIERQLEAAKHETHHILFKKIAEACGINSNEYKIYKEGLQANNAMHAFEKANIGIQKLKNKVDALLKISETKAGEFLDKLDDITYSKLKQYNKLVKNYRDSQIEVEARNASDNIWEFNGRDITEYENILRLHRGRTKQIFREVYENVEEGIHGVHQKRGQPKDILSNGRNAERHNPNYTIEDKDVGKDIKEYGDILRLYRGRTGKVQQGNNARNRQNATGREGEIHQGTQRNQKNVNGINSDAQRPNNSDDRLADRFNDNEPTDKILPKAPQVLNEKSMQNKNYRAKLSKLGEDVALDFEWITPEQANNRIKQQTLFGEGFYVKQVSDNKNPFVDLYSNPAERRNSKQGVFGKNTQENLKHNNNAQESTYAQLKETTNRLHTKNVFDFIEKEFAQKIPDNNRIPEGYVPVSRSLLSAAYYQRMSKDWYKTVTSGEEAIRAAFKDKKMADSWVEISNRVNKEDYMIPKSVFNKLFSGAGEKPADYISRYCKGKGVVGGLKAAAKIAGFATDYVNERFKRGVLTSMSFFVNNRIGNQQMIAAATEHPSDYLKSLVDMWKIDRKALSSDNILNSQNGIKDVMEGMVKHPLKFAKDICEAYSQEFSKLPAELVDSSIVEAFEHASANRVRSGYKPLDNLLNLLDGNVINLKQLHVANQLEKTNKVAQQYATKSIFKNEAVAAVGDACLALPNKVFFKISDGFMKFNTAFENLERKQMMSIKTSEAKRELLKKTGRKMIATKEIMEHIDKHPEIMSATVKSIEDIIGDYNTFNNFERRILKRAIPFYAWYRTITRNTLMMAKKYPTRFAGIMAEIKHLEERDEDLKEYQKGSIRTGMIDERSGKELLVNKFAQGIPWNSFGELKGDVQNSKGLGNFSPLYKAPVEAGMGKHLFRDAELTNKRYFRYDNAEYGSKDHNYKYYDTKTGQTLDNLPLSTRAGYLSKELGLKTAFPIVSSRMLNPSGIIQGIQHYNEYGKFLEPDKPFDADFGGYYNKDYVGKVKNQNSKYKKLTRYAANDFSEGVKLLNRFGGLSLQNKQPLNKEERKALKEKYARQRERMRGY